MGALTNHRNRVDECFNLHSPSPSFNLTNRLYHYGNQIDTHIAKKPRISYIQSPGKVIALQQSAVSRLSRYPEPEKLQRELHAPCRSNRFGFASTVLKRADSGIRVKALQMGNTLKITYEQAKHNAFGVLRYFKGEKDREVIDLEAEPQKRDGISMDSGVVEIVEDGNEVRSGVLNDHRMPGIAGLEVKIQESDGKALDSGTAQASSAVSELTTVEHARKMTSCILLDHDHDAYRDREAYKELLSKVEKKYANNLSTLAFEIKSTQARWETMWSLRQSLEKEKEEKKSDELKKTGEDLLREPFVPLTEEEERDVSRAFSHSNRRKILVTHETSNIEITGEILQCLRPGAWLNDEVINIYLELLKERERREPKKFLNCHFFNTFFYKKLIGGRNGYDYKAVRRWTTQRKLGYGLVDCDKIFVPIHKEVHWCLAVINKKDKSFQYLDSLGGRDHQVLRVLSRYFMDEVKDKSGQEIDVGSWKLEFVEDLPEQQNGFDCGVFMIKYADFYSRGLRLLFSQENMPYFRLRTAKEILRLRAD